MVLEAKVAELERDLATAGADLTIANRQFSEVTNRLQVVVEEATQLREDNSKLSQDLDGEA
jgi:regulator of replication initiation timing